MTQDGYQLKAFAHPPTVAPISPLLPPLAAHADCWACPGDHLLICPFLGRRRHLHLGLPPQSRTRRYWDTPRRFTQGGRFIILGLGGHQLRTAHHIHTLTTNLHVVHRTADQTVIAPIRSKLFFYRAIPYSLTSSVPSEWRFTGAQRIIPTHHSHAGTPCVNSSVQWQFRCLLTSRSLTLTHKRVATCEEAVIRWRRGLVQHPLRHPRLPDTTRICESAIISDDTVQTQNDLHLHPPPPLPPVRWMIYTSKLTLSATSQSGRTNNSNPNFPFHTYSRH